MRITEPATMLTDYGLTVLSSLFAWWLWTVGQRPNRLSVRAWALGFASLGMASLAGGTVHGLSLVLSAPVLKGLWKWAGLTVGLAGSCFLIGTLFASVVPPVRRWLISLSCVQLLGYVVWINLYDDFRYVVYNYGATCAVILVIQIYYGIVQKWAPAGWIVTGILITYVASAIQQNGIALHPSFNHNDLYHVIQMVSLSLLYRGAVEFRDR